MIGGLRDDVFFLPPITSHIKDDYMIIKGNPHNYVHEPVS